MFTYINIGRNGFTPTKYKVPSSLLEFLEVNWSSENLHCLLTTMRPHAYMGHPLERPL